jgi:exonuclease VII large subunit
MKTAIVEWQPQRAPVAPVPRKRRPWVAWGAVFTLALAAIAFHVVPSPSLDRVSCNDVTGCREQSALAEARLESCAFFCENERADLRRARERLREQLENEAQHRQTQLYRELDAHKAEAARETARTEALERRATLEAEERAHARRLEEATLRAEQRTREQLAARERRKDYFSRLTLEQKRARLLACYETTRDCDELTELLVEASLLVRDQGDLVRMNETLANRTRGTSPTSTASSQRGGLCNDNPHALL